MEKRPALMLPMGKTDYETGERMAFLKVCQPILLGLGWTIGVELRGSSIIGWGVECLKELQSLDGRVTWHLPASSMKKPADGLDDQLIRMVTEAYRINQDTTLSIEAITVHCASAVGIDPFKDAGIERYNSPISTMDMLSHIKAQIELLKDLNKWAGGILSIENLDFAQFRDGGHKVPTFLELRPGCWKDLGSMKRAAGVGTTIDSEHYFGAHNFLCRLDRETKTLSRHEPGPDSEDFTILDEFIGFTGYWLTEGFAPHCSSDISFESFVEWTEPTLFHLGGSIRAIDDFSRIDTHLPNFDHPLAKKTLKYQLAYTLLHPEVIGCVIEVTGQLEPDKYSEWSPRPCNDEVAKMLAYLAVINKIEVLQKTHKK